MSNSPVVFPLTSSKRPACQGNWREYKGEAKTSLIGVVVPAGVIVLDVDAYKGVTTDQIDQALGCSLEWDCAELQETPRGGKHYAFAVPEGVDLTNGVDVFGVVGFDTRSAGKGYIATGDGYEPLGLCDTTQEMIDELHNGGWPELPAEALELLKSGSDKQGALIDSDDGDESMGLLAVVANTPLDLSREQVTEYMGKLDAAAAENSDQWLKIGMALYHQSEGASWGWDLFDAFSQRCPEKYDRAANLRRWKSFDNKGASGSPVTFASVIKMTGGAKPVGIARDAFAELKTQIEQAGDEVELEGAVKSVALAGFLSVMQRESVVTLIRQTYKRTTGMTMSASKVEKQLRQIWRQEHNKNDGGFVEDYIYILKDCEYFNRVNHTMIKREAFNVRHNRETPYTAEGEVISASEYASTIGKIPTVDQTYYAPGFAHIFERDDISYANTYKASNLLPVPESEWSTRAVETFKGHVKHLIADEREQDIFISYLAHNIQHPGRKMNFAMVLQGMQGDGKSYFYHVMEALLGQQNCNVLDTGDIESGFSAWAVGQCFKVIEEIKITHSGKWDTMNKLKTYITNEMVSVTGKGKDPVTRLNTTNYLALTNYRDAIPMEASDRRYCIIFSKWQSIDALREFQQANPDYYADLYDEMRAGHGELLQYLMTYEINKEVVNAVRAPLTEARELMMSEGKTPQMLAMEDLITEYKSDIINEQVVNLSELNRRIAEGRVFGADGVDLLEIPERRMMGHLLRDLGYVKLKVVKDYKHMNVTVYAKDSRLNPKDYLRKNPVNSWDD